MFGYSDTLFRATLRTKWPLNGLCTPLGLKLGSGIRPQIGGSFGSILKVLQNLLRDFAALGAVPVLSSAFESGVALAPQRHPYDLT